MFVLEEFRGKGIGTKLFKAFFDWCKEKGVEKVKIVVNSRNEKALNFDRGLGFKDYSIILEKDL